MVGQRRPNRVSAGSSGGMSPPSCVGDGYACCCYYGMLRCVARLGGLVMALPDRVKRPCKVSPAADETCTPCFSIMRYLLTMSGELFVFYSALPLLILMLWLR